MFRYLENTNSSPPIPWSRGTAVRGTKVPLYLGYIPPRLAYAPPYNFGAMKSIWSLSMHLKLFKPNFEFFVRLLKHFLKLFEFVTFFQKNRCFLTIFLKFVKIWNFRRFLVQNAISVQTSNCFRKSNFCSINLIFDSSESSDHALNHDIDHYIDTPYLTELCRL